MHSSIIKEYDFPCVRLVSVLKFLVLVKIFLIGGGFPSVVQTTLAQFSSSPARHFRENLPRSGLCFNQNVSCIHQNPTANASRDDCMMIHHHKNSSVCSSPEILVGQTEASEAHGKFAIKSYLYVENNDKRTGLNISFVDVKWSRIYMRFIENQVRTPSLCREFQVDPELSLSFYFDCLWNLTYETKIYHFEFQALTPTEETYAFKYIFYVPNALRIDFLKFDVTQWEMFLVLDVTTAPRSLELRIQTAPRNLGVTGYKVAVLRTLEEKPWVVLVQDLDAPKENEMNELRYLFDTKLKFGKYKFQVTPVHKNCSNGGCKTSVTPEVLIVEMTEPKLLTGIVVTVILIPILLMCYFFWKRNCDPKDPLGEPTGPPKFLMMYKPVSVAHMKVMMELYKYFTKVCHVQAMMDQFGIPESESKDPDKWYRNAFADADIVGIFASPEVTQAERDEVKRYNRYLNCERLAQSYLCSTLSTPGVRSKFFSVVLPGTDRETLPTKAQALKSYILPLHLDPLLVLLGVTPQCDGGEGFLEALSLALASDSPPVARVPTPSLLHPSNTGMINGCTKGDGASGSSVRTATVDAHIMGNKHMDGEDGPSNQNPTEEDDDGREDPSISLCCNTQSASELDLVSSRQYLSDMSAASSMDRDSLLLGEPN